MIIALADDTSLVLEEPDDFKSFKVTISSGRATTDSDVAGRLTSVGKLDGDHLFVDPVLLFGLAGARPTDEVWVSRFADMAEFARSKGWVDEYGRIRAHIEES